VSNIYEVAKRAGVSPSTVSRVLSKPNVVSIKTRLKVLRAVDVLGYIPNSTAKNLRTSRTGKLLVTVPDISNPFFSLILQGIEDAAQREDYAVLVGDTQHDDRREQRYALMLNSKEADGLIFLGHRLPEAAAERARAAAPRCAPSSTAASSTRGSAFPACTSTMRAPPPMPCTCSTISATSASGSSPDRWSVPSAATGCAAPRRPRGNAAPKSSP
jgi:DNA-binding LacI/PurR family transcriptional regulator